MKLIFAIVRNDNEDDVTAALNQAGFYVTRLSTTGGFLRRGNATLMIVTYDERVDEAITLIRDQCGARQKIDIDIPHLSGTHMQSYTPLPVSVEVGGATIFVTDVERFEHF